MSIRAMAECWGSTFPAKADGISPQTVRLVALAVADVVNDLHDNEFWGARRLLAEKVGCDPDTVGDVLKHLCHTGVAEVMSAEPGFPVRYRWRGCGDPPQGVGGLGCGDPPQGSGEPPQGVRSSTAGGAVTSPHEPKETEMNTSHPASSAASAKRKGVVDKQFDTEFFVHYPKGKPGKGQAREYWRSKKMTRADRAAAIEGIQRHVAWWVEHGTEPQFIPASIVWLHQRRWEDDEPRQRLQAVDTDKVLRSRQRRAARAAIQSQTGSQT